MHYRKLNAEDIDRIMNLGLDHPEFDCVDESDFWKYNELKEWLKTPMDICVGCFIDEKLIAYCLTHLHKAANKVYIENLYVHKTFRTRKVGTNLINLILNEYHQDLPNLQLRFIGLIFSDNTACIALMKKTGFKTSKEQFVWVQL